MSDKVTCQRHGHQRAVYVCDELFSSLSTREPAGLTWFIGDDGDIQAFCDACWTAEIEEFRRRTAGGPRLICLTCLKEIAAINGTWLDFNSGSGGADQPELMPDPE